MTRPTALAGVAKLLLSLLLLAAGAAPASTHAQERILSYDTEIEILSDGTLDVTEHITVRAEGNDIRRGIYRTFPTRYRDDHGNAVVAGFEMLQVLRDGKPTPWFTEDQANGVRINTGNDDVLPVPATYTFTLRYRTTRQLGFFDDHDELYWNAIGHDWMFPIERASVVARLPEPVPVSALSAEAYTGSRGSRGQAYVATLPAPGTARWELTAPLPPRTGFTVVLSFPKGLVAEPTRAERTRWFLRDNLGVLIALLVLVVLVVYCARRWHRVGRDPAPGVVIARYEPPADHTPGGLRYILRMGADNRAFSADLLWLAVAGHLRIHRDDAGILGDAWKIERLEAPDWRVPMAELPPALRTTLDKLFAAGPVLELDSAQATILQAARSAHAQAFRARYQPSLFKRNGASVGGAAGLWLAGSAVAFFASDGAGIPLIIGISALMLLLVIAFGYLVRAPTPEGRRMMDEIEGLKLYLGVAERDALARVRAPGEPPPLLDAGRYERLLPYAVALDVEDAWTEQFTQAAGAEAADSATRHISWYRGGHIASLSRLASDVGGALDARIASASTPPGGASGAGGGGFSGGGGGGGGGGGR
ncbi:MAG TPA: DUF2207 domain-containing protein [Xanthomonadaceae bacterium]|nr:DUF2207 domain-containing protein [Xanthomonadaceae bacterium]